MSGFRQEYPIVKEKYSFRIRRKLSPIIFNASSFGVRVWFHVFRSQGRTDQESGLRRFEPALRSFL